MRRHPLRFFWSGLCLLSLLTCAATCLLWRQANWWSCVSYTTHADGLARRSYGVATFEGKLHLFKITGTSGRTPGFESEHYRHHSGGWNPLNRALRRWQFAGARWYVYRIPSEPGWTTCFEAPLGYVVLLSALLPAARVIRRALSGRRRRPGFCTACGYDLRATPEGPESGGALLDRCPECGTVPGGKAAT
jgi:hypothetical protein